MFATSAPRPTLWITLGLLAVATGVIATRKVSDPYAGLRHQQTTLPIEAAPMCPWRNPEGDLQTFFPGASGSRAETRVLSRKRLELTRRLGRAPEPDENALHLFRVQAAGKSPGTIMVRRVKGQYGAIELVIATDPTGAIRGVRLQRQREPEAVSAVLTSPNWLNRFQGQSAEDPWNRNSWIQGLPSQSQASAAAIAEGVRSQLIFLAAAEQVGSPTALPHH